MSRKPYRRFGAGMLIVCASWVVPMIAWAEPEPENPDRVSLAKQLFEQALAELDAHNYVRACRKLKDVTQLLPEALGAQVTLAECYEGQGKLASAWRQFTRTEALATKAGDQRRVEKARARAAALKPRLATLVITVPAEIASVEGISIKLDGEQLSQAEWGVAIPMDTGVHAIAVSAPERHEWAKRVEVTEEGRVISVTVEAPPPLNEPASVEIPPQSKDSTPVVRPGVEVGSKEPARVSKRGWQRPLGWGLAAAGAVGVGVGAVLGATAIGKFDESNNGHCREGSKFCSDQEGVDLRDAALTLGTGSTAAFVTGGLLLAGGVALVLLAPSPSGKKKERSAGVVRADRAWVRLGAGSVVVGGAW